MNKKRDFWDIFVAILEVLLWICLVTLGIELLIFVISIIERFD